MIEVVIPILDFKLRRRTCGSNSHLHDEWKIDSAEPVQTSRQSRLHRGSGSNGLHGLVNAIDRFVDDNCPCETFPGQDSVEIIRNRVVAKANHVATPRSTQIPCQQPDW